MLSISTRYAVAAGALAAGLLLSPSALEAQAWSGKGRLSGQIVAEATGEPIEGATITLHPLAIGGTPISEADSVTMGPEPTQTDDKGRWGIGGLAGGSWQILIDAKGYKGSMGTSPVNEFGRVPPMKVRLAKDPYSAITVGDELYDAGNFAEARAEYSKAMEGLEPAYKARLRSKVGDTYFQEGDLARAREEYMAALPALEPGEQVYIRTRMADSYAREDKHAEARAQYEKVVPFLTAAEKAPVLINIARSYDQEGKRDQAIDTLKTALAESPGDIAMIQVVADLLSRAGRDEEAETYLAQLPDDATLPPDMLLNVGIRLYNENDMEGALRNFERVVEQNPDLAEAYYYRGVIYLGQTNNEGARADFNKFLEMSPDHPKAAEVQEFLQYIPENPGG